MRAVLYSLPFVLIICVAALLPLSLTADDPGLPEAIANASKKLKVHAFDDALQLIEALPDPDNPKAHLLKALLHEMGIGTEINADRALKHAHMAAEQEDWEAAQFLAWRSITAPEGERNLKEAIDWREKLIRWQEQKPTPRVLPETLLLPENSSYQPVHEAVTKWNHERARAGDAVAQYNMYVALLDGRGIPPDFLRSTQWLIRAANAGNGPAASRLSFYYEIGIGTRENPDLALKYLNIAAESGDADAQYNLALKLIRGRGIEANPEKGMQWLEKATASDHAEATYKLAEILHEGELAEADQTRAYSLYEKALALGKKEALYDLAYHTFYGEGVEKDPLKGISLHQQAAEEENYSSAYQLAQIYLNGWNVEADPEKAKFWADKAIGLGSDYAHYVLGMLLREGLLGEVDHENAFYHFEQAAREGHIKSQIEMGYHLLWGKGVDRDLEESYSWYQLAAKNGDAYAAEWSLYMEGVGWGTPQKTESLLEYFRVLSGEELDPVFINEVRSAVESPLETIIYAPSEAEMNDLMKQANLQDKNPEDLNEEEWRRLYLLMQEKRNNMPRPSAASPDPVADEADEAAWEEALILHNQSAKLGSGSAMPRQFSGETPPYPEIMRLLEIEENITAILVIGKDGRVKDVKYEQEPLPQFKEAIEAVLPTWRFLPAIRDGKPVAARVRLPVPFRMWNFENDE